MSLPVVKRDEKGIPTLYVHDKPFFMRSGEIHNSNASDPVYLEEKLWPALRGHCSCLLGADRAHRGRV